MALFARRHALARPTTDAQRVVAALVVGSILGGVLVTGFYVSRYTGPAGLGGLAYAQGVFALTTVFWFLGLLLVGGPVLGLLYALGIRSRVAAAATGAVLAFGAMMLLLKAMYPHLSGAGNDVQAAPIGVAGALVGWAVASVAYHRGRDTAR
jgi:hypothetical protein